LETIKATVSKIIFINESSGFRVLKARLPDGPFVTITGEFGPEMIIGTIADFHGDFKAHPKYGNSFKATSFSLLHNAEELTSIQLFIDAIAPNIGPERARLIISNFGKDTIDILDNNPEKLMEIEGIGGVCADSLAKAWKENREKWKDVRQEYSLRAFLNSLGIKERRVKRILTYFGGSFDAEIKIKDNPYLLTEIEGFGFTTADFIAKKLGVLESSPMRLRAFIVYALTILCPSNGHLYLTKNELVEYINLYSQQTNTKFLGLDTINIESTQESLVYLIENNKIIEDTGTVYSKPCYTYETLSASYIARIMSTPSDLILLNKDAVDEHIVIFERENNLTLSKEQRDALYFFIEKKVFVITGGPGTGKTLTLRAIVDLILKLKLSLTCMTPTGISAKKMADTINFEASTIHRRLGFRGNTWMCGESNKYETDVVIIDEVSMVDQEVFYRLLSALKNRAHIIFVGDHNQLPSVGAGNVLRELINCEQIPIVKLEQIFRQNEASDIIKVAHKIKNGDTDLSLFKSDPLADVFFLRDSNTAKIENFIIKLAQKFKTEKRAFQIITPRNDGPLSIASLNTALQSVLNPPSETLSEIKCRDFILRRGDRIIIRKNDYENNIFNGDIGKILSISGGFIEILIDTRIIQLSVDEINEKIRLAYAITIHRAQGLEYPYIIMPFINQFGRMLQRNLLYTALTRAKEKVIIIGQGSAIERAINNSSVYARNTKLGERIKICLQPKKKDSLPEQQSELADYPNAQNNREQPSYSEEEYSLTDTTEK